MTTMTPRRLIIRSRVVFVKVKTKQKEGAVDEAIDGLREFNRVGLQAIAALTKAAEDLQSRVAALEEFQRTLQTPGKKEGAN